MTNPPAWTTRRAPRLAAALSIAALMAGCARRPPPDPQMTAIHARFPGLALSWVTRSMAAGEPVACGYAGPPRRAQVFIARGNRVFVPGDLPAGRFDHWEDQVCGPDWIKPVSF